MKGFAVIDLETTGVHVGYHHRVVEIAVVQLDPYLRPERTWTTLVDPQRDVGQSAEIHGLTASVLAGAPRFADIAGDVLDLIDDRRLVAHNARFDLAFLDAEFGRLGIELGRPPTVCTLLMSRQAGLPTRLLAACNACGIRHDGAHAALADAMVTAQLFADLVRRLNVSSLPVQGLSTFRSPVPAMPSGRVFSRTEAQRPRRNESFVSSLSQRLQHLPAGVVDAPEGAVLAYADLLDRAIEDRVLTVAEMHELASTAEQWGLGLGDVFEIHRSYLTSLAALALADGVLTAQEANDLERVCDLLGVERATLRSLIEAATAAVRRASPTNASSGGHARHELVGRSVCFTGACCSTIDGRRVTRAEAELLAVAAGLVVSANVTKKLDVLVVADPETQSGKAKKARQYGTRIMAERTFWPTIGVCVD
jgi:DNA polymerase-3 subunit epsilon